MFMPVFINSVYVPYQAASRHVLQYTVLQYAVCHFSLVILVEGRFRGSEVFSMLGPVYLVGPV